MLSAYDDFPIHQTSKPVTQTATADLNHYDRYFFNGYTADGAVYFGAAMGLYPNREVADAAFSVVHNGEQISVFASMRAPSDRTKSNVVGPIEVRVVEPLRTLQLLVDAPDQGLRADLTFRHRTLALEEPPFYLRRGNRATMDYSRLTQMGSWEGWYEVDGVRVDCSPADVIGSRDRSWGIRGVGQQPPTAPSIESPQFFWLWAPTNFPGLAAHFDVNEFADGSRWHEIGAICPDLGSGDWHVMHRVGYELQWRPGTRRISSASVTFDDGAGGGLAVMTLEPMYEFQMKGIGYLHPEWGHGMWKGEMVVGGERLALPVADPLRYDHIHVQSLCRATLTQPCGEVAIGTGVLEQLAFGAHTPTGLVGMLDGYSAQPAAEA